MKEYKTDAEVSYAIGAYATTELLKFRPEQVENILISSRDSANRSVQKILEICRQRKIPTETADDTIAKISGSENCYAVGMFKKYKSPLQPTNHVVLVNPDDHGNLGSIIRTMIAYGLNNLAIIRPAADIFDPKVIRASMGSMFSLNVAYYASFKDYSENFKYSYYPFMPDGKIELNHVSFMQPYSLVFGNEGARLSKEYMDLGTSVRIPQISDADSLNLSVSVGIALYASSLQKT